MGRKRINGEQMPARFPSGTIRRIDTVLNDGETRSSFIRRIVERELKRLESKSLSPSNRQSSAVAR